MHTHDTQTPPESHLGIVASSAAALTAMQAAGVPLVETAVTAAVCTAIGIAAKYLTRKSLARRVYLSMKAAVAGAGTRDPLVLEQVAQRAYDDMRIPYQLEEGFATAVVADWLHPSPSEEGVPENDASHMFSNVTPIFGNVSGGQLHLYEHWKADLTQSLLSVREGREWLRSHDAYMTTKQMDATLLLFKQRALIEGVITRNPAYTGKPPHPEYRVERALSGVC